MYTKWKNVPQNPHKIFLEANTNSTKTLFILFLKRVNTILSAASSVDQPHQERGESRDDVPAGHGLQEGAAGRQVTGDQPQTGLSSAGWENK